MSRNQRNRTIEDINAQYGKLPPQAIEVEEAVLGALMIESDAYSKVSDLLTPDVFYKTEHQKICLIIKELQEEEKKIDVLQVTQRLKDKGELGDIGGPAYITRLIKQVVSAAHIDYHIRIIIQKYLQRELIRVGSEIQNKAYDDTIDVQDSIDFAKFSLNSLDTVSPRNITSMKEGMKKVYERITKNYTSNGSITGYPYGHRTIDEFTGGMQMTDLLILAAEPSQGKTAFLLDLFKNLAEENIPTGIKSLEMSSVQLVARITSQETGVVGKRILNHKLDNPEIAKIDHSFSKLENFPIYIDDTHSSSLSSVTSFIRFLFEKYGVRVFGVDYLQLITSPDKSGNREEALAVITRTLKNLAKELDVFIILLSQLKRDPSQKDHRPTLSRLRGSGQIEEAADLVVFIYRPETYGIEYLDSDNYSYVTSENKAIIIFAKGRNIGTSEFVLSFNKSIGTFKEDEITMFANTEPDNLSDLNYNPDQFHESSSKDDPF